MSTIAVDIDDTLYSFCDEAREQLSQMLDDPEYEPYKSQIAHALYASWDQWRTPFELCGYDDDGESLWLQCIDRCHDDKAILRQRPFTGAVETLCELRDAGNTLLYISNRATETEDATRQWLINNGFPGGELVVTSGNKAPFIKDCQYMIDDRSKTVIEFVYDHDWYNEYVAIWDEEGAIKAVNPMSYQRKAFVLVTDHNKTLTDVPGLYLAPTWSGLRRYMVKCGLIREALVV